MSISEHQWWDSNFWSVSSITKVTHVFWLPETSSRGHLATLGECEGRQGDVGIGVGKSGSVLVTGCCVSKGKCSSVGKVVGGDVGKCVGVWEEEVCWYPTTQGCQ